MDETLQKYECLLYLMSCALNGAAAEEELLRGVDLEKLLSRAHSHSVAAMVCTVLEKTAAFAAAGEETRKRWLEAKNKAIRKNMLLDAERGAILSQLEAEGIWYMPLKGSILKDWYPKPGMREMADNDILFDKSKREEVRKIFLSRGYEGKSNGRGKDDVYQRPPIYDFEMHFSLIHESNPELFGQYKNIKEKLRPVNGKTYEFAFAPEDFYVYAIVHACVHYDRGGTGIRTLADIYVMNRYLKGAVNRSDVERKLSEAKIAEYERGSRALAEKLFSSPRPLSQIELTQEEKEQLLFYCGSTTYGTVSNVVSQNLRKLQGSAEKLTLWAKLGYGFKRLFPGRDYCKYHYPCVYEHPYLLPFFWVWRIVYRSATNWEKSKKELLSIIRYK